MQYLITGGCGFLGSNLAKAVLEKGEKLTVVDNLFRYGSSINLDWLKQQGEFEYIHADVRIRNDVERVIKRVQPDVIFHLAGQVAMTTSLANPQLDFEINVMGGMNLLESVRQYCPKAIVVYSSTNKVYGDFEELHFKETEARYIVENFPEGIPETYPLNFHSPYGCSKGAADQYMLDYARMFGLKTIVFRHSSIYGGRQFSTTDQGWVGWFVQQALETKKNPKHTFTISGNGKQVRDLLFASDLVNCYLQAVAHIDRTKGQAFNIGGGMKNSLSLLELFALLEKLLGVKLHFEKLPWRESDQKIFVADLRKASEYFHWQPTVDAENGVQKMIEWVQHG